MIWIIKFIAYYILEAIIGFTLIMSYAKVDPMFGLYVLFLPYATLVSAILLLLINLKWKLKSWKLFLMSIIICPIGYLIFFMLAHVFKWF